MKSFTGVFFYCFGSFVDDQGKGRVDEVGQPGVKGLRVVVNPLVEKRAFFTPTTVDEVSR